MKNSYKLLLTMKLTVTLLLFGLVQVMASSSYSQSVRISLDMDDVSVEQVLDQIEDQSEFYFMFNQKLVNTNRKVDVQQDNEPIDKILGDLFEGTDVNVLIIDRQILLSPDDLTTTTTYRTRLQGIEITGNITDASGEALVGVNIRIKGTNRGTISDLEGNFSIDVNDRNAVLEFSYVGYHSQEISVADQNIINIQLEEDILGLGEVVVVGYGTQKKVNLSGAVDVI